MPYLHRPTVDIDSYAVQPRQYLLENDFIPGHIVEAYDTLTTHLIEQIQRCFERAGDVKQIRLHGDFSSGAMCYGQTMAPTSWTSTMRETDPLCRTCGCFFPAIART